MKCYICQEDKPLDMFYPKARQNPEKASRCRSCQAKTNTEHSRKVRREALAAYGGKCVKCGFDDHRALQFDHIHGGAGGENRRKKFAHWLKAQGWPKDTVQLLCANCNSIKMWEELGYE